MNRLETPTKLELGSHNPVIQVRMRILMPHTFAGYGDILKSVQRREKHCTDAATQVQPG